MKRYMKYILMIIGALLLSIMAHSQTTNSKTVIAREVLRFGGGDPDSMKIAVSVDGMGNFKWVYFTDFQDSINQGVYDTIIVATGIFDSISTGTILIRDTTQTNGRLVGVRTDSLGWKPEPCDVSCDDVRWTRGTDTLMTVLRDTNDLVGIGTTTPTAKLHVDGSAIIDSAGYQYLNRKNIDVNGFMSGSVNHLLLNDSTEFFNGVYYDDDAAGEFVGWIAINPLNGTSLGYCSYNRDYGLEIKSNGEPFSINGVTSFALTDGTEADGYVLTSDISGNASWQDPNCATGWESITDNTNTWTIAAGDTQTILIARDITVNPQLPCGIDSLYNSVDSTIIGRDGDAYTISLDWVTTQNTNNPTEFKWWINIGGAVGIIYPTTYDQNKGVGVSKQYNKTTTVYTLDTWAANGGKIQFVSDQSITISDVRINIFRIHKAR